MIATEILAFLSAACTCLDPRVARFTLMDAVFMMSESTLPVEDEFFRGRAVIVTGGGRGIGRAIAADFARLGARLFIVSQSANAVAVAAELEETGAQVSAHAGSVADEAFCRSVVDIAASQSGNVDVLVNAAATLGRSGPFAGCDLKAFADVLSVNLMGACNFMRWCLPAMQSNGFGRIVNFAGGGAAYSYPMFSSYGVSKAAIVRLTETVADEIKTDNVTVNVIAPGAVATDMLAEVRRRGGEVRTVVGIDEPVRLVRFLAGPRARHITGRFIHVRDRYEDPALFESKDMLKLRRTEIR